MNQFTEAEKMFLDDILEKRKETASRINSQKFKRMGKGSIRFATDLMNPKEKKQHMKAGEVLTSNLYDNILIMNEFEKFETHEQRNRLAYLRTKYSNKEIMDKMGLTNSKYYDLVDKLGLPKATRTNSGKRKATAKKAIAINEAYDPAPIQPSTATQVEAPAPVQEIIIDGLHLVYNGTFSPELIVKQLLKFASLLEDENDNFHVELKLMQKPKKEN